MTTYTITTTTSSSNHKPHATRVPETPAFPNPQTGWLSKLPPSCLPYAQLMRLDRPNGFWYFYLPHSFGSLHAATQLQVPILSLLRTNMILLLGTLIMRGATCTWNDTVDAPFDRLVARTHNRPVARGAVTPFAAHTFTGFQSLLSLAILSLLPPVSFPYALPAIIGWCLYPLAKRVTYYPQVVLGFPMAWGVFMGCAAVGADPLHWSPSTTGTRLESELGMRMSAGALYAANVLWTLLYEIIYSHQDAADDVKAGVKNIVLLYHGRTKPLLVKLAVGQVLMLAFAGYNGNAGIVYWLFSDLGAAVTLAVILERVRLDVPDDCAWWFKVGCCGFTGGAMTAGLLGNYVMTIYPLS